MKESNVVLNPAGNYLLYFLSSTKLVSRCCQSAVVIELCQNTGLFLLKCLNDACHSPTLQKVKPQENMLEIAYSPDFIPKPIPLNKH